MLNQTREHEGTLEQVGDQWRLRFSRHLAHTPDKVWRAVTEPEYLKTWFPQEIVGDWTIGGKLVFRSEGPDFDGTVLAVDPPQLLEFVWGTDTIRLELTPDGDGTLLTLLDTFAEVGKGARDAAGWHVCLDNLEQSLAGQTPSGAAGERWRAVHPRYVEKFGPEAATIGPPAGSA